MKKSYLVIAFIVIAAFTTSGSGWSGEGKQAEQDDNTMCLECHPKIFDWKTKRKDIVQLHLRHIKSKRTEYGGKQKMCVTCHEAWVPTEDPGWTNSPFYHPDTAMKPDGVWKKYIQRKDTHGNPSLIEAIQPANPYTFKPLLERLVCLDCHDADSKVKVLYGTK